MSWLVLAFIIPIVVALIDGSTYFFGFSISGFGLFLYVINNVLIRYFINKRAPGTFEDGSWEMTAGSGIVPKWVSVFGLLGMGFVPSGLVVALLLWLGLIFNRAA